jgi:hypothetical protein
LRTQNNPCINKEEKYIHHITLNDEDLLDDKIDE